MMFLIIWSPLYFLLKNITFHPTLESNKVSLADQFAGPPHLIHRPLKKWFRYCNNLPMAQSLRTRYVHMNIFAIPPATPGIYFSNLSAWLNAVFYDMEVMELVQ